MFPFKSLKTNECYHVTFFDGYKQVCEVKFGIAKRGGDELFSSNIIKET